MKKIVALLVALAMLLTCAASFAEAVEIPLYQQHLANEAAFGTLAEIRESGSATLSALTGRDYIPDPALNTYAVDNTYVYCSAGTFTPLSAAYRLNTSILVYTDEPIADKDAALKYITDLGLTEIADEVTGSIVLVTPINPASGFGAADQYDYLKLQSAMCNLGGSARTEAGVKYYADNTVYGGLTYRYAIGIGGGATFLCDAVASTLDYVGRLAGMLLINPSMNKSLKVAYTVPAYIVNGTQVTIDRFVAAADARAIDETADTIAYFNQNDPIQRVVVAKDGTKANAEYVKDAYYNLLVKTMRTPVVKGGLYVAANEFYSYSWNQAPYTLTARNAMFRGVTADGVYVVEHQEDRFAEYKASNGEYLRTWYEILPEEVLNNTAPEHSIPLILANHGGGDDPVQAADELGLLTLAGTERVASVAARYATDVPGNSIFGGSPFDVNGESLPALVKYMLETYPALDPSRVYATGYSMGGAATVQAVEVAPELFAAAVPMAAGTPWGLYTPTEEEAAKFDSVDVPMLFTTSEFDLAGAFDTTTGTLGANYQDIINRFANFNGLGDLTFDFEANAIVGFTPDRKITTILNGEYENIQWYINGAEGFPLLGVSYTELLPHGLHPEYGTIAWNFMKHYSRNQETGAIEYTR